MYALRALATTSQVPLVKKLLRIEERFLMSLEIALQQLPTS
jgi:hypothetical protein